MRLVLGGSVRDQVSLTSHYPHQPVVDGVDPRPDPGRPEHTLSVPVVRVRVICVAGASSTSELLDSLIDLHSQDSQV